MENDTNGGIGPLNIDAACIINKNSTRNLIINLEHHHHHHMSTFQQSTRSKLLLQNYNKVLHH